MQKGDKVKIYRIIREDSSKGKQNRSIISSKTWIIEKTYPHFVLMIDEHGNRECFSYWYLRRHMKPPRRARKHDNGNKIWMWE